jgi:predicted metal-binding protein
MSSLTSTMISNTNIKLLEEKAKELGANEAILIPATSIVVENKTILKCIFGCNGWGSRVCPPFIPTVDEFREMLKEYQWALLVDWKSENILSREISENFTKYGITSPENIEKKEEYQNVMRTVIKERKEKIQPGSLEIEKLAWTLGYNTSLATFPGMCTWCANSECSDVDCARTENECHHPTIRRPCLMGLGIRLDKTLEKLNIPPPKFPIDSGIPKQYTLILID